MSNSAKLIKKINKINNTSNYLSNNNFLLADDAINGDLVKKRQVSVGYEYFQWMTSDDERVRDRHEDFAEKVTEYGKGIYRWDNPPISDSGVPVIPGQDYQCRCNARPVSSEDVETNKKAGRTRPGVKR